MKNISKIAVSFLLALLVLVAGSAFTPKAQAVVGPTLTVGSMSTTSGSHVFVPIVASDFNNSVAGMDLLVSYDPTKLSINSVIESPSLTDPLFNEHYSPNLIYIGYLAPVDENFDFDNGVIATLDFTVLASSNTTTNLNFKTTAPGLKSSLYDIYGTKIPANYAGGSVAVLENASLTVSTDISNPSAGGIEVSNTNSTLDVLMNKFKIKDQGLNAEVKKISLSLTGVGATPAEIASAIKIKVGGDIVAVNDVSLNVNGIYEFTLDDNFIIPSGVTTVFSVYADINHLSGNFSQGDSFKIDYAGVTAEDINGNNITNVIGSADGEFQTFYSENIVVNLVSTTATVTLGEPGVESDSGLFDITFDVTAFGGDMWIDKTAPTVSGGVTESDLDITGTGNAIADITSTNAFAGTEGFLVEEGATRRFTITTYISPIITGFFKVKLMDLLYASSDINGNLHYAPGNNSFMTPSIYLSTMSPSIISVPKIKPSSEVKQIINKDIESISTENITEDIISDTVVSTEDTEVVDSLVSLDVVVVESGIDEVVKNEEVSVVDSKLDYSSEVPETLSDNSI